MQEERRTRLRGGGQGRAARATESVCKLDQMSAGTPQVVIPNLLRLPPSLLALLTPSACC
eukprot:COSAG02_NODE_430_length_22462_cov_52.755042_5_plen_60_part_00